MRFDTIRRRVQALELKRGVADATLHFADGSSRAVQLRDALGALCQCWTMMHAKLVGEPAPPASPYDEAVALFGAAESIEADPRDNLPNLLHQEARKLHQEPTEEAPPA